MIIDVGTIVLLHERLLAPKAAIVTGVNPDGTLDLVSFRPDGVFPTHRQVPFFSEATQGPMLAYATWTKATEELHRRLDALAETAAELTGDVQYELGDTLPAEQVDAKLREIGEQFLLEMAAAPAVSDTNVP